MRALAALRLREELGDDPPAAAVEEVVGWVEGFRESDLGREVAGAAAVDGALLREVAFLYKEEGVLLRGQIDLAVRGPDGAWTVADYKASAPPRRRPEAGRYERQLHLYARALRALPSWRGAGPARGALVYLDPETRVVEVPLGEADLSSARSLLARFREAAAKEAFPPDRSHCRFCPFGPTGTGVCPVGAAAGRRA